jgi:hypothetical protein
MAKSLQRRFQGWSSSVEKALAGKKRSPTAIMRAKPVTTVVVALLALISVAQLLRVFFQVRVVAGGLIIPLWVSVIACIATAVLAWLLWRERT